jgi:hypothetical protein
VIDFYNSQLGNYFSESKYVNIRLIYYKGRKEKNFDEIKIIQFGLPPERLTAFKNEFGEKSGGYSYFKLDVFTIYRYVIKGNCIYFVYTESYHPGEVDSYLDKVFNVVSNYN